MYSFAKLPPMYGKNVTDDVPSLEFRTNSTWNTKLHSVWERGEKKKVWESNLEWPARSWECRGPGFSPCRTRWPSRSRRMRAGSRTRRQWTGWCRWPARTWMSAARASCRPERRRDLFERSGSRLIELRLVSNLLATREP